MTSRRNLFIVIAAVAVVLAIVLFLAPSLGRRAEPPRFTAAPTPTATLHVRRAPTPHLRERAMNDASAPDRTAGATEGTPDPAAAEEATPEAVLDPQPLGLAAANSYRERAQYPPWSQPLLEGEDPILRDREVSPITAAGPNGEEPVLTVFPDKVSFESPEPAILYAYLSEAGERVPAQEIRGTLMTEALQPLAEVEYRDDGGGADPIPGDHVYTAHLQIGPDLRPDLSESFLVRVFALTEDGLERIAASGFLYSNPAARLTGSYRDGVDDGSLAIVAEVEVLAAGRFHLEGTLYAGDGGRSVAWAQAAADFAPGRHWMRLSFYGRILAQSGIDGPYLLRFVALSTTSQMPNAKNALVEDAFVTAPYRAADFSAAPFDDPDLLDAADRLEQDFAPGLQRGG